MATTIKKCPLCGGTISVYANVETRLTLYDGEAQAYELTTGQKLKSEPKEYAKLSSRKGVKIIV